MEEVTRVAVIGAGAAGLVQIKQLVDAFNRPNTPRLELVCFESRANVGGTWNIDLHPREFLRKTVEVDGKDVTYLYPPKGQNPSPLYEGLRTNLPHDLMSFRGFPFPNAETIPTFPDGPTVLAYLEAYAGAFGLREYVRFETRVERLYKADKWVVESVGPEGKKEEIFDYVSIANGHYSDSWVPDMPGLGSFPGKVLHSREYRRPSEFTGRTVLVVGNFASGSDVARQLASMNEDYSPSGRALTADPAHAYTKIYQSSSAGSSLLSGSTAGWKFHIHPCPLISHFEPPSLAHPRGKIVFSSLPESHDPIDDVDVVIYATGYNFAYPFCKATDEPWKSTGILDGVISPAEREGGDDWEVGGVKGLGMKGLDELMLFLQGDRTVAFPALPYQVVPFPLSEVQGRLCALLWAGLLPSFPAHPRLPPNPNNPFFTPPPTAPGTPGPGSADTPPPQPSTLRTVFTLRQKLVFVNPYEWTYEEFLMSLMSEADGDAEDHWKRIEPWRRARRADADLRKKTLGY